MANPYLSIIIPAHNEEHRLPNTLEKIFAFLVQQPYSSEVLVVENGSQDRTLEVARSYLDTHPHLHVLHEGESGKGRAVRHGMVAARGEFRFMFDADASMPVTHVNRFLPPALGSFDIAIASREAPGAIRYGEPSYRHLGGRAVNAIIRLMALPGLQDTQCGFKCFRGSVADDLFGCQTMTGWSFDVELLVIARRRGYRIVELPIPWYYNSDSKVSPLRDTIQMSLDILAIRWNALRGRYDACPQEGSVHDREV